jgi:hypothetical protein
MRDKPGSSVSAGLPTLMEVIMNVSTIVRLIVIAAIYLISGHIEVNW